MKSLVIAEKPSVARDIARVLKCGKPINGAMEGPSYVVTWGLGHLVTLADPEDYEEIVTPEKRGGRYFSVFAGDELIGFFCVEREGGDLELGLGLRPDLTGQGRGEGFLREILRFVGDNDSFARIRISVASFNKRAIKVYERAGFVKTGTAQVPANGGVYDFTLMEWKQKDEDKASDRA